MARVRLITQNVRLTRHAGAPDPHPYGIPFLSTDGAVPLIRHIPWYRLIVRMYVGPAPGEEIEDDFAFDAILDTGAPLTCIPFEVWEPFADRIRWLDQPPREDVDDLSVPLP